PDAVWQTVIRFRLSSVRDLYLECQSKRAPDSSLHQNNTQLITDPSLPPPLKFRLEVADSKSLSGNRNTYLPMVRFTPQRCVQYTLYMFTCNELCVFTKPNQLPFNECWCTAPFNVRLAETDSFHRFITVVIACHTRSIHVKGFIT